MRTFSFLLCLLVAVAALASARKTTHARRDASRPCSKARLNADGSIEQCKRSCKAKHTMSSSMLESSTSVVEAAQSSATPSVTLEVASTSISSSEVTATATESTTAEVVETTAVSRPASAVIQAVVSTTSAAPAATSSASAAPASGDEGEFVDMHNAVRQKYGAVAVTWNSTLADYAQSYASKCLKAHSGGPYGENLATSVGFGDAIATGVNGWAGEASSYDWNNAIFGAGTGHFTQMVWKGTTQIGCAHVECPSGSLFSGIDGVNDNVVCEYYPPGNVQGAFAENVGTAV